MRFRLPFFCFFLLFLLSISLLASVRFSFPTGQVASSPNLMVFESKGDGFKFLNGDLGIRTIPSTALDVNGVVSTNTLSLTGSLTGVDASFNSMSATGLVGDGSKVSGLGGGKYYLVCSFNNTSFGSGNTKLTPTVKSSTGITVSGTTITLPSGRTYMGFASVSASSAASSDWANMYFKTVSGTSIERNWSRLAGPTYTGNQGNNQSSFFVTTTAETEIELVWASGSGTFSVEDNYSYGYIWEL